MMNMTNICTDWRSSICSTCCMKTWCSMLHEAVLFSEWGEGGRQSYCACSLTVLALQGLWPLKDSAAGFAMNTTTLNAAEIWACFHSKHYLSAPVNWNSTQIGLWTAMKFEPMVMIVTGSSKVQRTSPSLERQSGRWSTCTCICPSTTSTCLQ